MLFLIQPFECDYLADLAVLSEDLGLITNSRLENKCYHCLGWNHFIKVPPGPFC